MSSQSSDCRTLTAQGSSISHNGQRVCSARVRHTCALQHPGRVAWGVLQQAQGGWHEVRTQSDPSAMTAPFSHGLQPDQAPSAHVLSVSIVRLNDLSLRRLAHAFPGSCHNVQVSLSACTGMLQQSGYCSCAGMWCTSPVQSQGV